VLGAAANETFHSTLFDIGWPNAPHRVLRNSVIDTWERAGRPPSGQRPGEGEVIGEAHMGELAFPAPRYGALLATTEFSGDVEKTALYAGQSCGLVDDLRPAAEIVERVARDAEAILRGLPGQLCA
jgi:nitronate monooxygenase